MDRPLVPLEAHIMSKCPDAKVGYMIVLGCLQQLLIISGLPPKAHSSCNDESS